LEEKKYLVKGGVMPAKLIGLSAEEIERRCTLPLVVKSEAYGPVESWFKKNETTIREQNRGKYVLIDAITLNLMASTDFDQALRFFKLSYGETPEYGRSFLGIQL
jgi:hypothetical protein